MRSARLGMERLESRSMLAGDVLPPRLLLALDVDGDRVVAPADALNVIQGLNTWGAVNLAGAAGGEGEAAAFASLRRFDANGDSSLTPLDALTIINRINENGSESIKLEDVLTAALDELTPEQRASIDQLFASLNEIRADSNLTSEQLVEFMDDVVSLVGDAAEPTEEQVDALVDSFWDVLADGELTAAEVDSLKSDVRQLLLDLDVDPAELDAFLDKWQGVLNEITVEDVDLDALLTSVESLVNAFAPGALNLPSADFLLGQLNNWIDVLPGLVNGQLPSNTNPPPWQQAAGNLLNTFTGSQLVGLLDSPALTVELPVLGSLNPKTAISALGSLLGNR
jgi:hypothetical protein